jgi:hypothetical protein
MGAMRLHTLAGGQTPNVAPLSAFAFAAGAGVAAGASGSGAPTGDPHRAITFSGASALRRPGRDRPSCPAHAPAGRG